MQLKLQFLSLLCYDIIWRGAWNKSIYECDSGLNKDDDDDDDDDGDDEVTFWHNVKFSLCFTREYNAIWEENLTVY